VFVLFIKGDLVLNEKQDDKTGCQTDRKSQYIDHAAGALTDEVSDSKFDGVVHGAIIILLLFIFTRI
jgi:hypothetical protein